jgi:hypothetical protein
MTKAIIGIGVGLALMGIQITGRFAFDTQNTLQALWVILAFSAWPVIGWGSFHFAKARGYAGGAGGGLFMLALLFYVFLVHGTRNPYVYALGTFFVAAFPVAVLLALPRKNIRPSQSRRNKRY